MISVGRRVQETIDYMDQKELLSAMTPICIAIDITAQRHMGKATSAKTDFKQFVRDYLWLISYMGFPGLMANAIRIPFSHPRVKPDANGNIGIEDVIYHAIRSSLIHEDEKTSKIVWDSAIILGNDPNGNLILSKNLVWGLVGAVVFCPVNASEKIPNNYWISIADFKMFISDVWGRIDIPKRILKVNAGIEIP